MSYFIQKLLVFVLIFSSVSLFTWTAIQLIQSGIKEYEDRYVAKASKSLAEMFIFQDVRQLFLLNVIVTIFLLFIGLLITRNVVYIMLFGCVGFLVPRVMIWRTKKKRLKQFEAQLVDGLVVLANALRSGLNLIQAIEILEREMEPPISQEFGLVIREYRIGVNIEDALDHLAKRVPNEDLKLLVTSINIVLGMGGNLMEIFETMADIIGERSKLEGKTKALTSQGKLQGLVVGFLPTFIGIIMYFMDPASIMRLFTSMTGNSALGVMFGLQITGFIFIKKITNVEV